MKKSIQILAVLLLIVCDVNAQQEKGITGFKSWLNNWTEFKPNKVDYDEVSQILTGNITADTKLYKKNVYLLQGNVYVTNKAVLTIEPGTVIMGDSESKASLIITKGSSIIANGLETDPIVFTSNKALRKAGDWGGIIILGDAPTNKFGNASSVESPMGWMPRYEDIDWTGLDFTKQQFDQIMLIDREQWKQELLSHAELFERMYDRLPKEFIFMRELLLSSLWRSPEKWKLEPETV